MNISKIKGILADGDIPADKINPMINASKEKDLSSLSQPEKETLREVITKMLVLIQDQSSGAHLDDPEKAELLLSAISW